jgi:hypothetical protein
MPRIRRSPLEMRVSASALIATHLGAVAVGWAITDKTPVDEVVKHDGFFQITTSKVLATTVESLRDENRLLVFSYKGDARVRTERTKWWLFGGRQELSVPAVVNYHVDLSDLSFADVSFNEKAKIVTVRLPKLIIGDVAFQPEHSTTINGGLLTWDDDQVEALRKLNYVSARRAMVAQAQQAGLINAAQRQARENVVSYFEIPLRIAGQPDVKVVATFR